METYLEPARQLPIKQADVVVVGGGTAGVIAAIAAARQGARTVMIEAKGYVGGIAVEGGTALHSFYNLWKAFPGVEKRQVIRGIPQELVDRLAQVGGTSGHAEMTKGYDYDSICTAIDTELYKLVAMQMLQEAGVDLSVNTLAVGAAMDGSKILGVITESRSGREVVMARCFIDSSGYGDLAAHAGCTFTEPNDHPVANSIGVAGVSLEKFRDWIESHGALQQLALGMRSGVPDRIVRIDANSSKLPPAFVLQARQIGLAMVTTTVHDDYFMFLKLNYRMSVSPTSRDAVALAELELRKRQLAAIELLRRYVPGCEKAFITRSSPSLCIRRGRCIACDYDISIAEVLDGRHFEDDVFAYGFHDCAPRLQIKNGGTYGLPYRALRAAGVDNLLLAGMLITSNWEAHMSTRNTVSCMAQGQAVGTAAALCAQRDCGTRELPYAELRKALEAGGVYFE